MTCAETQITELLPTLEDAIHCVQSAGSSCQTDAATLAELKERLVSGRFHLAVLGQFKRGKSSLLNALLAQSILPTAVTPLTAVPTWVRAGAEMRARIEFANSAEAEELVCLDAAKMTEFLARFVTESGNPLNRLGVSRVELFHPAPILKSGVVFIDTPGIGSTFGHNTQTTLQFLPQCDAALFLVSADPPVTQVELEFLRAVRPHVSRLFFVLNKVDYLNPVEADEAVRFFRQVIVEQGAAMPLTPVFPVSARQGLSAKSTGDAELWRTSGMAQIEQHLVGFLAREKAASLREAVRLKAADVVTDLIMRLSVSARTLELPLEDLLRRMEALDRLVKDLNSQRIAAHDLLAGDRRRASESLERQYHQLRQRALRRLNQALDEALASIGPRSLDENALQESLHAAIPALFDAEFHDAVSLFDRQLGDVLRPHQERLDQLVESIRKTAADLFNLPYRPMAQSIVLNAANEPYWVAHRWDHGFGPISPGMIDKLAPPALRRQRIERRFRNKIEALVLYNAGLLRERLQNQIEKTFTHFGHALDDRLAAVVAATHGAAQAALRRRDAHAGAVTGEMDRFRATAAALRQIEATLLP